MQKKKEENEERKERKKFTVTGSSGRVVLRVLGKMESANERATITGLGMTAESGDR